MRTRCYPPLKVSVRRRFETNAVVMGAAYSNLRADVPASLSITRCIIICPDIYCRGAQHLRDGDMSEHRIPQFPAFNGDRPGKLGAGTFAETKA